MKKFKDHRDYYLTNKKYSTFLDDSAVENFNVYLDAVNSLYKKGKKFLDVGCGTGIVVNELKKRGVDGTGVEISQSSLEIAKKKRGTYHHYDGERLPFADKSFDIVGSFDVVEHVTDVELFLKESLRVLKKNGYLIICTPNFLSITNSYHHRTQGIFRKFINLLIILKKLFLYTFFGYYRFDYFEPIVRKVFQPDDDAIVLTNMIDFTAWGAKHNLTLIESRGSILPDVGIKKSLVTLPIIKYFFGGVYFVFKK